MICADTSFLISLYATDANTSVAQSYLAKAQAPPLVHPLNDFELKNAARSLVCRRIITTAQSRAWISNFDGDKTRGILTVAALDLGAMLLKAETLSATHSELGGHRGFDILLVAAALTLGATEFWSFDNRQRALAAAEGLTVGP